MDELIESNRVELHYMEPAGPPHEPCFTMGKTMAIIIAPPRIDYSDRLSSVDQGFSPRRDMLCYMLFYAMFHPDSMRTRVLHCASAGDKFRFLVAAGLAHGCET